MPEALHAAASLIPSLTPCSSRTWMLSVSSSASSGVSTRQWKGAGRESRNGSRTGTCCLSLIDTSKNHGRHGLNGAMGAAIARRRVLQKHYQGRNMRKRDISSLQYSLRIRKADTVLQNSVRAALVITPYGECRT